MFNTVRFSALARVCALSIPMLVAGVIASVSPVATGAAVTYTSSACTSFALTGTPPNQTLTCVSGGGGGGGGGGGVPVCTPSATKTSPTIGQSTTISANCTNQPTAYVWTGSGCAGIVASSCTVTKSTAKTVVFTVQASNPAGQGVPAQISITWH